MFARNSLIILLASAALAIGASANAATGKSHSEEGHERSSAQLSLDHGKKWPTDAPLRKGMASVRGAVGRSAKAIHAGKHEAARYEALAGRIEAEMALIVANCKLPPEADAQLHIVLAQMSEGADAMKRGERRDKGAEAVIEALNAYGKHFEHPGWRPIRP